MTQCLNATWNSNPLRCTEKLNINDLLDYTKGIRKLNTEQCICPSILRIFGSGRVRRGGAPISYTSKTAAREAETISWYSSKWPGSARKKATCQANLGLHLDVVYWAKRMQTDLVFLTNQSGYCLQGPWCCAASPLSPLPLQLSHQTNVSKTLSFPTILLLLQCSLFN